MPRLSDPAGIPQIHPIYSVIAMLILELVSKNWCYTAFFEVNARPERGNSRTLHSLNECWHIADDGIRYDRLKLVSLREFVTWVLQRVFVMQYRIHESQYKNLWTL